MLITEKAELVNEMNHSLAEQKLALKLKKTINALILDAERWSETLLKIHEFQPHKRGIWITTVVTNEQYVKIQGVGIIIPDFSDYLDKSLLKNIITQELREREANKFEINMNPRNYGCKGSTSE